LSEKEKHRKLVKKIQNKRTFRKIRGRLKRRINFGAKLENKILSNYKLRRYKRRHNTMQTKSQLINRFLDLQIPLLDIVIPEVFCFLREPEETSKFFMSLNKKIAKGTFRNINVDHRNTREIGLSASWIFDECIKSVKDHWTRENKKLYLRGTTSSHRHVNNFLMAFGFLKEMKIEPGQIIPSCDPDYENKFKHFKRSGTRAIPYKKGNACTELVEYFNSCLGFFNKQLTHTGRIKLVDAFGEIIDNAEEHGGQEVEWHVLGCFDKISHYVNFTILNKGFSIFETLSDENSTTKSVLEKIEKVVLDHRSIFQKANDFFFWDERGAQTIWNVMALQEGISSKRTGDFEGNTRGQGMMDVLEFIAEIRASSEDAQVAVISGHSYVLVDYEYPIRRVEIGQSREIRRQISFNREGDLSSPQDSKKVRYLEYPFPGTIITGRFKLSANYVIDKPRTE
jgi:hypothetical protein